MKKINVGSMAAVLAALSLNAWAGGSDSAGGGAMVCRDASGKITKAELLDLWELKFTDPKLKIERTNKVPYQDQIQTVLKKAEFYFGKPWRDLLEKETNFVQSKRISTPIDQNGVPTQIPPPTDTLYRLKERGCELEGVAQYSDTEDSLTVDEEIFAAFSETDKAALYMHEGLYRNFRNNSVNVIFNTINWFKIIEILSESNSLSSRSIIRKLFSNYAWELPINAENTFTTYFGKDNKTAILLSHRDVNNKPIIEFWTKREDNLIYSNGKSRLTALPKYVFNFKIDSNDNLEKFFSFLGKEVSTVDYQWAETILLNLSINKLPQFCLKSDLSIPDISNSYFSCHKNFVRSSEAYWSGSDDAPHACIGTANGKIMLAQSEFFERTYKIIGSKYYYANPIQFRREKLDLYKPKAP